MREVGTVITEHIGEAEFALAQFLKPLRMENFEAEFRARPSLFFVVLVNLPESGTDTRHRPAMSFWIFLNVSRAQIGIGNWYASSETDLFLEFCRMLANRNREPLRVIGKRLVLTEIFLNVRSEAARLEIRT